MTTLKIIILLKIIIKEIVLKGLGIAKAAMHFSLPSFYLGEI